MLTSHTCMTKAYTNLIRAALDLDEAPAAGELNARVRLLAADMLEKMSEEERVFLGHKAIGHGDAAP